jgi:CRP-like cAMP-binding protein
LESIKKELTFSVAELSLLNEFRQLSKLEWFVTVVTLTDGHSFGELALIDSKPRRAAIECLTDCAFAIYSK